MSEQVKALKDAIRNPYAWPGGYTKVGIMSDGAMLCVGCLQKEYRRILWATKHNDRGGWAMAGIDIYWEGPTELCAHCGSEIASEYGE